jgi:hypothetical protein
MESDTKRVYYLENGGEARIAVLAESLVETLATQARIARDLRQENGQENGTVMK